MHGPREVLNELKWRHQDLEGALIHFIHRGAPNDTRVVAGSEVARLESWHLVLRDAHGESVIPYHRVFLIEHRGRVAWERRSPSTQD